MGHPRQSLACCFKPSARLLLPFYLASKTPQELHQPRGEARDEARRKRDSREEPPHCASSLTKEDTVQDFGGCQCAGCRSCPGVQS